MLYFKDVPVLIEIGVAALEVGVVQRTKKSERLFYVHFERLKLQKNTAAELPFVVSSSAPHIFTMSQNLSKSPFLLVYDYLGKLTTVYSRENNTGAWLRSDTAPEQVGDTVTLFSVRLSFESPVIRDNFLSLLSEITMQYKGANKISRKNVAALLDALNLTDAPATPVILPVAVAKVAVD
jgi:hypothetical protein